MAPSLMKMAVFVAAILLLASTQAQGSATTAAELADMVPVSLAESVMAAMPGGGGTMAAPVCLQCRCCSRTNPAQCQITGCCSTFNCNPAGRCTLVQQKCGCGGCGGAN
ncbi:hypothetical protein EJB05_11957 [Eragrostis curvula]|uniref:Bowman-Birk serine protease inhibitors family domain-containing protein n=1 Tax=Eragrostis curvula TaxID=38414 RepID=A0A5J9VSM6_9POAL|nr:hypothetical protein EJB05_11957 [Eragrostis curvula]